MDPDLDQDLDQDREQEVARRPTPRRIEAVKLTLASIEPIRAPFYERIADRLGICLSALCVVHCVLTPLIVILLPSLQILSAGQASHESYHRIMLIVLPILALLAFIPGFRLHRDGRVFRWAIPGLSLIALGALAFHGNPWLEAATSICGSLFLIRSHLLNRVLCSCCESGHGKTKRKTKITSAKRLLSPPRKDS